MLPTKFLCHIHRDKVKLYLWRGHQSWTSRPGASAETSEWKWSAVREKKRKVSVSDKQQIDSISRVFVERFEKLQRKKFLSLFMLICCHYIARNISIGKTKHFFNNQINKSLGAQPTKSRISEFFMKKQTILSPIGLLLICSGSHFLMLREALHLCATGDQLRHSLWLKTMKGWKKSCAYTKKEKCFTPQNFIHKLVQKGSKVPMSD